MKVVIRAGGVGTRLWPLSRRARPKQFHALAGPRSMLQDAMARVRRIAAAEDIYVSAGAGMGELVAQQLPELPRENLIVEPTLRNTAPAVGLECLLLEFRHPGCSIASVGSDHFVAREAELCRLLEAAERALDEHPDTLFTIGVRPTRPETGYGYIQRGSLLTRAQGVAVYAVRAFTEKPDLERARGFVASGEYLWNANLFVWKAATVLELIARFEPALYEVLMRIRSALGSAGEAAAIAREYPKLPNLAIDNAVIERAEKVATLEADVGWSDIGSWDALSDVVPADVDGNRIAGEALCVDARGVTLRAPEGKLVALVGVEDLVVIDTEDALLVCRKDQAQRVKDICERLAANPKLDRWR